MSDALEGFTTEELLKIKQGDVSGLSTEKLNILKSILSQSIGGMMEPQAAPAPALAQPLPEAPTQRLRSIGQGVTMGAADEMEARLRASVTGEDYGKVLS
jgi:hypothetical protein